MVPHDDSTRRRRLVLLPFTVPFLVLLGFLGLCCAFVMMKLLMFPGLFSEFPWQPKIPPPRETPWVEGARPYRELPIKPPERIEITVNQSGEYTHEGRRVTLQDLDGVLRRARAESPTSTSVFIAADRRCMFDCVAALMNLCNRVGIQDYQVKTAPGPTQPP